MKLDKMWETAFIKYLKDRDTLEAIKAKVSGLMLWSGTGTKGEKGGMRRKRMPIAYRGS